MNTKEIKSGNLQQHKRVLITGITGMDGSYLAELLLSKGYEVHGLVRRASTFNRQRIEGLDVKLHYGDMTDPFSLLWALKESQPDEIYNLAAQSHVQVSWETPFYTAQTTGIGVLNLLEAVRVLGISPKIYQASTSELFDGLSKKKYNEESRMNPVSPYGTAKLYAYQICKNYREAFGMFICNGILFNHESARRGDNFVTKKICNEAPKGKVHLGNTDAKRDWGYAPDYVEGMWRMLQQKKPDDYVLATGETHTVKEFVGWVEKEVGHKIKIIHDKGYERPTDVPVLCGDASKAKNKLKWKAKIKGHNLVKKMITL
jgi:GDPmannose 4,6-dehydratase